MTDHEWIPDAVAAIAARIEIGKAIGDKLLSLQPVWRTLAGKARQLYPESELSERRLNGLPLSERRLNGLPPEWHLDNYGIDTQGVSLADRALAAFYVAVVIELGIEKPALTAGQINERVCSFRATAKECRAAVAAPGRPACDEGLARSLRTSAEYFDELADSLERRYARSTNCLPRSSRKRNDDGTRVKVRALAQINHSIFGEFIYVTLGSLSESLLDARVAKETIVSWCKGCEQTTSYWHQCDLGTLLDHAFASQ
jgi:hypothetical protein